MAEERGPGREKASLRPHGISSGAGTLLMGPSSELKLSICLSIAAGVFWVFQVASRKGRGAGNKHGGRLNAFYPSPPALSTLMHHQLWDLVPGGCDEAQPRRKQTSRRPMLETWPGVAELAPQARCPGE